MTFYLTYDFLPVFEKKRAEAASRKSKKARPRAFERGNPPN
jgi:hypothetical protein